MKRKTGAGLRMVPPGMEVIQSTESLLQDAELISLMNKSLGKERRDADEVDDGGIRNVALKHRTSHTVTVSSSNVNCF